MQAYSDESRESEPTALPDIEVFQLTAEEVAALDEDMVHEYSKRHEFRLASMNSRIRDAMIEEASITGGWFWQSCFPGCLPDSEPIGPFKTSHEALADARSSLEGH